MIVEFIDNKIGIKRYPFLRKAITFYSSQINFVKFETNLIYLCIDSKEIIFIPIKYITEMQSYANRFNLLTIKSIDVWELICYPFVDSYRTVDDLNLNIKKLNNLSFTKDEVVFIRKKIKKMMLLWSFLSLEMSSLTHYDVLIARKKICFFVPFYKRFYWYTMRIALRGFSIK